MRYALTVLVILAMATVVHAGANLDFSLHKLDSGRPGPTILVVGGIQGDEPGGFSAAALLISHYKITSGALWVVPNLNFPSIIRCSRGLYGDMNRKFADLDPKDPEYAAIQHIKAIITDPRVDAVLHLHDGWGFYRPTFVSKMESPLRWGQAVIIDQEAIGAKRFGNLRALAQTAVQAANEHLYDPGHAYRVKNTHTQNLCDETAKEMSKTLTFFAIGNHKPAFGIEGSKNLPPPMRTYYHLRVIESFLRSFGITFERTFPLGAPEVAEALRDNMAVSLFGNRIYLDLRNARARLKYIPFQKGRAVRYRPASPIMALVHADNGLKVFFGNTDLTQLDPEYREFDSSIDRVTMDIDGQRREVPFGEVIRVNRTFRVEPRADYRTNVIGLSRPGLDDEAGQTVGLTDLRSPYSVDKDGTVYRVEVYRGEKFCGMILAEFQSKASRTIETATAAPHAPSTSPTRDLAHGR